ncbi:MAG: adenylate/guanylate cyclase domain-containing protein [Deltaproteobacteria bacterium]|nr:adenylate/guanylate cyclase domain-containing protein [Deltaproteobacteria bacterium]
MSFDFSGLGLTELIRLREQLSSEISRRFEKKVAVAFSDVVGSTQYFARFGDHEGRALQQRHFDVLTEAIAPHGGRIVDTAGDGAFLCFPSVDRAVRALADAQNKVAVQNAARSADHHLVVRIGIHFGPALTDGTVVTGDSVNLCARVTSSAAPGAIRLTKAAFTELSSGLRLACKHQGAVEVKGLTEPVDVVDYGWRRAPQFPSKVVVEETRQVIEIPRKDVVTFGRLAEHDGSKANDVVLTLPDEASLARISRWHFELRQHPDGGCYLRRVSDQSTEVNGIPVARDEEVRIHQNAQVRLGGVMTLVFFFVDTSGQFGETALR